MSSNVGKRPVAIISIEHGAFTNQTARPAIHRDALEITRWILSQGRDFIEVENQVVGNEQIQMAVAIIIHPCATCAPPLAGMQQPGLLCHIAESTIPIVAIQNILRPTGNKKILETVVVVVPHRYATGPALAGESGLCSHVGKSAITIVLVEPIDGTFDWPRAAGA